MPEPSESWFKVSTAAFYRLFLRFSLDFVLSVVFPNGIHIESMVDKWQHVFCAVNGFSSKNQSRMRRHATCLTVL